MNNVSQKVGYWSAMFSIAAFLVFTLCFIAILFVNPLFIWSNLENYIKSAQSTNQSFKHTAMISMLLYGACFIVQLSSIEDNIDPSKKFYIKTAELFGIGFFTLIAANYFIQLSTVRMQISSGQTHGLEQLIQSNPLSGIAAVNMLGWTIFYGISCVFASLAFNGNRLENTIRYAFLTNGIMMLLGSVSYLLNIVILVFLLMNLGMGTAVLTATIALAIWFKRLQRQNEKSVLPTGG